MFEPLKQAISAQYEAFTSRQPRDVEGCEHCTTPDERCILVAAPREVLTGEQLAQYAFKAVTTMGSATDLRYFWPRLVELALNKSLWVDTEIVFGKATYARHNTWPEVEQRAIHDLAAALGQRLAAEKLSPNDVDSSVCSIGLLMEGLGDPRPMLEPLMKDVGPAWTNLCRFIEWNADDMERKQRFANAFWENAPKNAQVVFGWFQSHPRAAAARTEVAHNAAKRYGMVPPKT